MENKDLLFLEFICGKGCFKREEIYVDEIYYEFYYKKLFSENKIDFEIVKFLDENYNNINLNFSTFTFYEFMPKQSYLKFIVDLSNKFEKRGNLFYSFL